MPSRRTIVALTLGLLLALVPSAHALKSGTYKGKTTQNQKISFKVSHNQITKVKSYVNALCVEYGGAYSRTFEGQRFLAPGAWRVERSGAITGGQHKLGRFRYTLKGAAAGRKKVKGSIELHYERIAGGPPIYFTFCTAQPTFTAKLKKRKR